MNNKNLSTNPQAAGIAGGKRGGTSIFACSLTLLLENFKLYWYIPLLSFAAYFFGGIFPIITHRENIDDYSGFLTNSFANYNVAYLPLLVFVPLIASVTVMNFYHRQDRAIALHSQPLSKSRIFNSQILSGWLMCALPLLLTALLYLCFMTECNVYTVTEYDNFYSGSPAAQSVNVYTAANIACWLGSTTAMMTFFYGLYTLAGALVGTGIMQVLLSGVFFGACPMILFIAQGYCQEFLRGYSGMSQTAENLMIGANPAVQIISNFGEMLSLKLCLIYLAAGVLALVLARLAYGKAKLEKVGDSMMFRTLEELITWLISFVGATACGMIFYYLLSETLPTLLLGVFVGLLATYFVVKIIIAKSVKVFTKRNLISFGIAALICLLFLAVTVFDLTGYHKRVPAESRIAGVYAADLSPDGNYAYLGLPAALRAENQLITDPVVIEKVRKLHKICVELSKNEMQLSALRRSGILKPEAFPDGKIPEIYKNSTDNAGNLIADSMSYITCRFHYQLQNGKSFKRSFTCFLTDEAAELITELQAMPVYQDTLTLGDKLKALDVLSISANVERYYIDDDTVDTEDPTVGEEYDADAIQTQTSTIEQKNTASAPEVMYQDSDYDSFLLSNKDAEKVYGLIEAMDQDIREQNFYQNFLTYRLREDQYTLGYIDVSFTTQTSLDRESFNQNPGSWDSPMPLAASRTSVTNLPAGNHYSFGFDISKSDKHTLAYLADLGYSIGYGN